MCIWDIKDGGSYIPLYSSVVALLLLSTFNFLIVTHHLRLIYIILLFILQLSQSIRLHVHFFPSLVSLFVVFALFQSPFLFLTSHLFESKVRSQRQVRTQEAFYLFILHFFFPLCAFLSSPPTLLHQRQACINASVRSFSTSSLRHATHS